MSNNIANNSETRREDWGTPSHVFDALSTVHDFAIDLCATKQNALCKHYIDEQINIFSPNASDAIGNALDFFISPHPYAFINPPYQRGGKTGSFVARAAQLSILHEIGLVALIPASVGSVWWRDSVDPFFNFVIFTPRLKFKGAPATAQFDTAICVRSNPHELWGIHKEHEQLGAVYKRVAH